MDRAIAAEVEELLLGHGAVSTVSVIVRSHAIPVGVEPSVSIVAQVKKGSTFDQEKLRDAVIRSVPGVKPGAVSFSVSEQSFGVSEKGDEPLMPFLRFWKVPMSEYNSLALLLLGLMSVVAFLSGIGGYIYGQYVATKGGDSMPPLSPNPPSRSQATQTREEDEEI
jgi:hypothetical protein